MGGICRPRNQMEYKTFNNYHCKRCGEIPIIDFWIYDFNIFCSNHKLLNIPIDQFYDYIAFDYKCQICKKSNNCTYCYDCDIIYCKTCIMNHDKDYPHFISNNIIDKNITCKLHNRSYSKFCLKCKLNLCDLCENSYNHCTELFSDIYPLDEDIIKFKKLAIEILKNLLDEKDLNEELIFNNHQENDCIRLKILFIDSFSRDISNYNYINNINNIIRSTFLQNSTIKNIKNEMQYIHNIEKYYINNIENKKLIKSISKINTNDFNSQTYCMIKLNDILINPQNKLELIAIGGSNHKILLLNVITFNIHQIIDKHKSVIYSLVQFKEEPNFLFSSSGDSTINLYKLNDNFQFKLIQKIKKLEQKKSGEIYKIIMLTNKLLASGDHNSITIWKSNNQKKEIYYEIFKEIIINRDSCNLLEVNQEIFVATQYTYGGYFQVYKNEGKNFPLIGQLIKIQSHGNSSNGLAKINDKLVCSTSDNIFFYIICIEPLQIIQKIKINSEKYITILYLYVTKDDYLYCKGGYANIIQYKIKKDEDNNFIELIEIGKYNKGIHFNSYEKAILPFDDGRIFFVEEKMGQACYNLIA